MKNYMFYSLFLIVCLLWMSGLSFAQSPVELQCGDLLESNFTENGQVHEYHLPLESGMIVNIFVESKSQSYEDLRLTTGLISPNDFQIWQRNRLYPEVQINQITDWLSAEGVYQFLVQSITTTGGGYTIAINCLYADGNVTSANNIMQKIECGSIVQNLFERDMEQHRYFLYMKTGDQFTINGTVLTDNYQSLTFDFGLWAPNDFVIDSIESLYTSETPSVETDILSTEGIYELVGLGRTADKGEYELTVTCILADGTVVQPGDVPPVSLVPVTNETLTTAPDVDPSPPPFTGFGFPGLAPVDLSSVPRIPLTAGFSMGGAVTPTGSEIIGYEFDAEAGDRVNLEFAKVAGNLNLGFVVIDANSNVIHQASLITAESISTRLAIPATGQYTAAIYRIDLFPPDVPEATAFQLTLTPAS